MIQNLLERDPSRVFDRLSNVVDQGNLSIESNVTVAEPTSDLEVSELLRVAGEENWRVLPKGAGLGPADTSKKPELVISTARMTQVVNHEPGDLNATVRAGITMGALQSSVSKEGQWLALDPPGGSGVTIGGVVSSGVAGTLRPQYGRPRDHVLGLTLVDGMGRVLSLGGRVVKNVAGFDLVRLSTGGRGAFGMITQVTLRLHPRPEDDRTLVWFREQPAEAWQLGRTLVTLPLPVAAAELLMGAWTDPLGNEGPQVVLRLTGSARAVERTTALLTEQGGKPDRALQSDESAAASQSISEGMGGGPVSFRIHSLPSRGLELLGLLEDVPFERLALHLLGGTFRGTMRSDHRGSSLLALADKARESGATLTVTGGGEELSREVGGEGGRGSSRVRLQSDLVQAFDPAGILPGAWREGWRVTESARE